MKKPLGGARVRLLPLPRRPAQMQQQASSQAGTIGDLRQTAALGPAHLGGFAQMMAAEL